MTFRLLAVLAVFSSVSFAQRITITNFAGPGAAAVRNQLVSAVCDAADCVTSTKTTTGNKPDWKKARKESVLFFVNGTVLKKGKALSVELQVLNTAGAPKARKAFALDKGGTLAPKTLQSAMDMLTAAFAGGAAGKAEPEPEPEVTPPAKTPTSGATKQTPPPSNPPPQNKRDRPADPIEPEPAPPVSSKKHKHKFLVVDAGADVVVRTFAYQQVATPNLRRYTLPPTGQPSIGLQFYPLALGRDPGLIGGLGVDVNFAFATWIQSRLISAGGPYPTSTTRFDAGLRFDIVPSASFPLTITPWVGVRHHTFTVGEANGTRLDGLPGIAYFGLRAGLMLDVPIIPDRLSLFGRFLVLPMFSSGEIISSAFFPNGSTFGFEANGGVGVWILPMLQVRASFEFINYGLTFRTNTGDTYVAAGATDTWIGGNASVRLAF
jgi:hypothetical protein